ncbi:MAG TPA: LysR family transcriptional regulator [Moraxellaceae bacterium]|nr:LysR family transcriptional regulator [Moraxellaceae bacterium]
MNPRTLDLNLLRVLDALVRERHVTRAAEQLHLSQPAMSNALNRLRTAIDDPVLVRGKGGMVPTPRALSLAEPVRAALASLEQALLAGQEVVPAELEQTLTVAMADYYGLILLPPLLNRLRIEAPGVKLSVLPLSPATVSRDLGEGRIDLALGILRHLVPDDLHSGFVFADDFVCIARQGHPAIRGRLTLKQFLAQPHALISPRGGSFFGVVDEELARQGLKRDVVLSVPQFMLLPPVIRSTDLIATMPRRLARHASLSGDLQLLKPPVALSGYQVHQVWHPRTEADPVQKWLRGLVSEVATALDPL